MTRKTVNRKNPLLTIVEQKRFYFGLEIYQWHSQCQEDRSNRWVCHYLSSCSRTPWLIIARRHLKGVTEVAFSWFSKHESSEVRRSGILRRFPHAIRRDAKQETMKSVLSRSTKRIEKNTALGDGLRKEDKSVMGHETAFADSCRPDFVPFPLITPKYNRRRDSSLSLTASFEYFNQFTIHECEGHSFLIQNRFIEECST